MPVPGSSRSVRSASGLGDSTPVGIAAERWARDRADRDGRRPAGGDHLHRDAGQHQRRRSREERVGRRTDGALTQPETDATIDWTASLDGWVARTGSSGPGDQRDRSVRGVADAHRHDHDHPARPARRHGDGCAGHRHRSGRRRGRVPVPRPGDDMRSGDPRRQRDAVQRRRRRLPRQTDASGDWRIGASSGVNVADVVPFTVSPTDGSISRSLPLPLALEAPTGP